MGLKSELLTVLQNTDIAVRRPARAAGAGGDWSPAADFNIFSITGGPVRITGLIGVVTATFAGANAIPLVSYYPLVAGIAAITAMAAVAVAAAWPEETILTWAGTLLGVLAPTVGLGHGQAYSAGVPTQGWVGSIDVVPGFIQIVNAGGAADATGQVDWYCTYRKLGAASQLVAVP